VLKEADGAQGSRRCSRKQMVLKEAGGAQGSRRCSRKQAVLKEAGSEGNKRFYYFYYFQLTTYSPEPSLLNIKTSA